MKKLRILVPVLLCLTLGLAPFGEAPHLVGKANWILGGAKGMQLIDYFDFFLHLSPWVLLVSAVWLSLREKKLTNR